MVHAGIAVASLSWLALGTTNGATGASKPGIESLTVAGVAIDVFTPHGEVRGDLLVLPGWDSSKEDWCKNGGLCDEAEKRGFRLVMPEMKKSNYARSVYPETSASFRASATRQMLEDAIAQLQKERGLLANKAKSYVIGRSTGARGVALLVLDHPEWFRAGAALSGDYDPAGDPKDGLMIASFGPLAKFPERWHGDESPTERIDSLAVPLYLGHGQNDATVNPERSLAFGALVKQKHPTLALVVHIDEKGAHNHAYWRTELAPAFDFFASTPQ